MKIKSDYLLRQIAGTWVIFSLEIDSPADVLTINDAGVLLWKLLTDGCEKSALVQALTDEYEVSSDQASMDVDEFIGKLRKFGCLEEK